jgi:UDPglucose--hexose-1-phosphate uridylyltransferase
MSEFRQNIASGEWVIIAPERAKRPVELRAQSVPAAVPCHSATCPFCKGNEHMCAPAVYEVPEDGAADTWSLRIVPNIYAAVSQSAPPVRERHGLYLRTSGYGVAQVLVESPDHATDLAQMELGQVESVVRAYRRQFNLLSEDPNIALVSIFKNHGQRAGASMAHPHSQIIATMVAPPHITDQIIYARRAYSTWGRCVYCDMVEFELQERSRLVMESAHFVAFCPFASKYPYEVRIFPRRHAAIFGTVTDEEARDLALVLRTVLSKLRALLGNPDYNFYVRSVPTSDGNVLYYHWHIAITPRLSQQAGFELGTRIFINTSAPEVCAEELRGA